MQSSAELDYAVVSPVRDEERFLRATADSILAQTRRPIRWVIVDDGSADATGAIADELAAEHEFISVVHRPRRATRERGRPIVEAFEAGRSTLDEPHDVVVKLDGDLHLPAHYFEWVLDVFERDPRAGLVGGIAYVHDGTSWRPDRVKPDTVNGVAKAYRVACLVDIGGLQPSMGWDGIDEYAARARGWEVVPLTELMMLHYKLRGSAQKWWPARREEGRGMHFMGYGATGVVMRVVYRGLTERPAVLSGVAMLYGYVAAALRRDKRVPDEPAVALLRNEHRARLRRAITRTDAPASHADGGGPAFWWLERR